MQADIARSGLWIALAAFASVAALVQTARLTWGQLARSWKARARTRRATAGEVRAEAIVARAGYEVLARQVPGRWTVHADGEPMEVALRADLLVSRNGRRYVAEVKTGRVAPKLDCAATRRQLLEYRVAFGVDGVLLVDAESNRVVVVELGSLDAAVDDARSRAIACWFPVFAFGVAAGALLVLFAR